MNIYFSCSIIGGRSEEKTYQVMVDEMLKLGHEVPTAHLSQSNVVEMDAVSSPAEIYSRDMNWLLNCDAVIAEVTSPSHGVGYEIAVALGAKKPVLCCYQKGRKVSSILIGNSSPLLSLCPYSETEEVLEGIRLFTRRLAKFC
jgi:hypothetical protein